jgi:hypothetical protein
LAMVTITSIHCEIFQMHASDGEKAIQWATTSLRELSRLASSEPSSGVTMLPNITLSRNILPDNPAQNEIPDLIKRSRATQIAVRELWDGKNEHGYADAHVYTSPHLNTRQYLRWLSLQVEKLGGTFVRRKVNSLQEVATQIAASRPGTAVIVNCTGLEAAKIVPGGDAKVYPVRGQTVMVKAPWIKASVYDFQTGAYCIPNGADGMLELGGTSEKGQYDRTPCPKHTYDIVHKNLAMLPSLQSVPALAGFLDEQTTRTGASPTKFPAHAEVEVYVGLRPAREGGPRVELEWLDAITDAEAPKVACVHNYGHGGAGLTVSYG